MQLTEELTRFDMINLADIVQNDNYQEAAASYNQGLKNARSEDYDLAGLNLRRALEVEPDMACAIKLLSLVYAQQGEYAKGYRLLNYYLNKITEDDEQAFEYMTEIKRMAGPLLHLSLREERRREKKMKKKGLTTVELQNSELVHDYMLVLGGIIIGVLACYFLIFPSVKKSYINDSNQKIMSYGNEATAKEVQISNLNDQIDSLEEQVSEYKTKLSAYTGKNGIMDAYADLIAAIDAYADEDYAESAKMYLSIKTKGIKDKNFMSAYNSLKTRFEEEGIQKLFDAGYAAYKSYDYSDAISNFKYLLKLKKDYPEAMYWMALAYYNNGNTKNAQKYFYKVQKDYPDTVWASNSKKVMPYTEESDD